MNNKELRLEILKYLKNRYDKNPHSSSMKDSLLEAIDVSPKDLDRNIKYLNDKYLLNAKWYLDGVFMAQITSHGIDEIEMYEETPKKDVVEINDLSVPQNKFQQLRTILIKFKNLIILFFAALTFIAVAINSWQTVSEFIVQISNKLTAITLTFLVL